MPAGLGCHSHVPRERQSRSLCQRRRPRSRPCTLRIQPRPSLGQGVPGGPAHGGRALGRRRGRDPEPPTPAHVGSLAPIGHTREPRLANGKRLGVSAAVALAALGGIGAFRVLSGTRSTARLDAKPAVTGELAAAPSRSSSSPVAEADAPTTTVTFDSLTPVARPTSTPRTPKVSGVWLRDAGAAVGDGGAGPSPTCRPRFPNRLRAALHNRFGRTSPLQAGVPVRAIRIPVANGAASFRPQSVASIARHASTRLPRASRFATPTGS